MPAATKITWRDAQEMPEDGKRYEAIGGELYVTPAPKFRHQLVSGNLFAALRELLMVKGHGVVAYAPVGVEFPETEEGVQPDLLFISKARMKMIGEDWIRGAPDLVVEILSPTTARRDRTIKRQLYQRQGVGEYWIVDADARQVEVWRFGLSADAERYTDAVPLRLAGQTLGSIPLSSIFDWPY